MNFVTKFKNLITKGLSVFGNTNITGNLVVDTNTLFVDSVNDRVGIGTTSPSGLLEVGTFNTTNYTFKTGGFTIQPYSINNGFLADNSYFSNSGWSKIVDGYASGFHFYNGQVLFNNSGNGVAGNFTQNVSMKTLPSNSGSVALGGNISVAQDEYGGATMVVLGTGNVGIGTATPAAKLDVNGTTLMRGVTEVNNGGSIYLDNTVSFTVNDVSRPYLFNMYDSGAHRMSLTRTGGYFAIGPLVASTTAGVMATIRSNFSTDKGVDIKGVASQSGDYLNISTVSGTGDILTVLANGNVGIGTTNPLMKLDIQDAGGFTVSGGFKAVATMQSSSGDKQGFLLGYDTNGGGVIASSTVANGQPINFWTYNGSAWGERMRISKEGNVGIGTTTPNSKLQVSGSVSYAYIEKTANYTLTSSDYTVNCTTNSFTITLPTAVGITGRVYFIKNTGTGIITVDADSTETIDGESTQTVTQWDSMQIQSTGSGWIIL